MTDEKEIISRIIAAIDEQKRCLTTMLEFGSSARLMSQEGEAQKAVHAAKQEWLEHHMHKLGMSISESPLSRWQRCIIGWRGFKAVFRIMWRAV